MSTVLRFFLIDTDGVPRRIPITQYGPLFEGTLPVPKWAAKPALCAEVALWCENRRPVRILRALYKRYAVDARGRIDQSVKQGARVGFEITGSLTLPSPPAAPLGRERFLKRQYAAFFWTPTPQQERAIGELIYGPTRRPPGAPGPRPAS